MRQGCHFSLYRPAVCCNWLERHFSPLEIRRWSYRTGLGRTTPTLQRGCHFQAEACRLFAEKIGYLSYVIRADLLNHRQHTTDDLMNVKLWLPRRKSVLLRFCVTYSDVLYRSLAHLSDFLTKTEERVYWKDSAYWIRSKRQWWWH